MTDFHTEGENVWTMSVRFIIWSESIGDDVRILQCQMLPVLVTKLISILLYSVDLFSTISFPPCFQDAGHIFTVHQERGEKNYQLESGLLEMRVSETETSPSWCLWDGKYLFIFPSLFNCSRYMRENGKGISTNRTNTKIFTTIHLSHQNWARLCLWNNAPILINL